MLYQNCSMAFDIGYVQLMNSYVELDKLRNWISLKSYLK